MSKSVYCSYSMQDLAIYSYMLFLEVWGMKSVTLYGLCGESFLAAPANTCQWVTWQNWCMYLAIPNCLETEEELATTAHTHIAT